VYDLHGSEFNDLDFGVQGYGFSSFR